jgi:hypothetical protein
LTRHSANESSNTFLQQLLPKQQAQREDYLYPLLLKWII